MNQLLIKNYLKRIEALNLRERILLTLSGVAVLFLIIDLTLLAPLSALQKQAATEVTRWQANLALLELDAEKLGLSDNQGNFLSQMGYAKQLQNQITDQQETINTSLATMIGPEQLPKVFADLLKKQGRLALSSLLSEVNDQSINLQAATGNSLEPVEQTKPGANDAGIGADSGNPISTTIVRTNLSASYRGNYQSTRKFLNALAQMPWALLWHQLEFEVTDHPDSTINVDAYTLGTGLGTGS
ncbi:MAG: type II secretion system protein M [Immundisolibacteraceae bacterium]|nr:type II secretion system protein M [Immundisolibacteraceae bacterium]